VTLPSHANSKNAIHVKYLVGVVMLPSHANSKNAVPSVGASEVYSSALAVTQL